CSGAQKYGWHTCPSKAVPAATIEQLVIAQLRSIHQNPAWWQATLGEESQQNQARRQALEAEQRRLQQDLVNGYGELQQAVGQIRPGSQGNTALAHLSDLQEQLVQTERQAREVQGQIEALQEEMLDEGEATEALAALDRGWETWTPNEQARLIQRLV